MAAFMAEREGFEPPVPFGTTVFETAPLSHSGTSPNSSGGIDVFAHSMQGFILKITSLIGAAQRISLKYLCIALQEHLQLPEPDD
jgi:hypothetical protein